jgi:hypothetical protein
MGSDSITSSISSSIHWPGPLGENFRGGGTTPLRMRRQRVVDEHPSLAQTLRFPMRLAKFFPLHFKGQQLVASYCRRYQSLAQKKLEEVGRPNP